ncbi:MAG: OmpA family protein [Pseudomonadota bacterium]
MKNTYSVSLMALAITVSSMTTVWAQSTTTEPAQEQAQPATEAGTKQDAPAPEAEAAKQDPEPVKEEAAAPQAEAERSDAEAAPETVKEEKAKPAKKKKKKAKKEKAGEEQPAGQEAAPAPEAAPPKQEAAPAPEADPAKQQAAPAPETDPAKQEAVKEEKAKPAKKDKKAKKQKADDQQPAKQEAETEPAKQQAAPETETDPPKQEAAPAPETDPAKQEAAPAPKATDPAKKSAAQPQSDEPSQQKAEPAEDPKPEVTVKSVLRDDRPPAGLTDTELRQRIQAAADLADGDKAKPKQKARLKAKAEADTAELNARIAAATGVTVQAGAADAEAAKITADDRPAAELKDKELRQRIKQTRGVLAAEGLSEASTEQLRAGLSKDTAEIRQRVAVRRNKAKQAALDPDDTGKQDDLPEANPGKMTVGDLIGDTRPGSDLTVRALRRRIDANRRALTLENLSGDERKQIRARLEDDRDELSQRLVDRRKRRKKGLSTGEAIAIGAGVGLVAGVLIASRPTITAAEAYDEELEDWLVSPPLVEVKPRYRIQDFAEQPRLRYSVPGIEVDTIQFGFGEGFLRTEEVPKLDRIGAIIERIVAGNPNEVFLIEGHTDAVGSGSANLALSTERASAVKQALLEYFEIGEENLSTVGRGEAYLKIPTQEAEAENRRVTLRRITPLLAERN